MERRPTVRSRLADRLLRAARALGWTAVMPVLRARAHRRSGNLGPWSRRRSSPSTGTPGVICAVLIDLVRGAARRGPRSSSSTTAQRGRGRSGPRDLAGVRTVLLPINMGHDFALDLGVLLCRTEFVVTLDVDAFPLHDRWLEELEGSLRAGAEVAGARLNREYVHPCCWAMRTARFVESRGTRSAPITFLGREIATPPATSAKRYRCERRRTSASSTSPASAAPATSGRSSGTSSTTTSTRPDSTAARRRRSTGLSLRTIPLAPGTRHWSGTEEPRARRARRPPRAAVLSPSARSPYPR